MYIHFIKDDGVYKRKDNLGVKPYTDEEDIEDVVLDDERERNWHMVLRTTMEGWMG